MDVIKSQFDKKGYEVEETETGFEVNIVSSNTEAAVTYIQVSPTKTLSVLDIYT